MFPNIDAEYKTIFLARKYKYVDGLYIKIQSQINRQMYSFI